MLLLAEGLFRFDIVFRGDTLRTLVRNLSPGALEFRTDPSRDVGANVVHGAAKAHEPGRAAIEFALGTGADQVTAKVLIGTSNNADRGTVLVTAQAIVRQAPAR